MLTARRLEHQVLVYIIDMPDAGCCKIGVSAWPEERLLTLQTGSPFRLELSWHLPFPTRKSAVAIEAAVHKAMFEFMTMGEWFRCPPEEAVRAIYNASFIGGPT